jgi:hypothetical protein
MDSTDDAFENTRTGFCSESPYVVFFDNTKSSSFSMMAWIWSFVFADVSVRIFD